MIAPTKITDFAPLYCDDEGHHPVTQFDKNDVEYAGLVKFDFLGLRPYHHRLGARHDKPASCQRGQAAGGHRRHPHR
ncbi:hypothetical protein ACLK12_01045 [Escherichia coli]